MLIEFDDAHHAMLPYFDRLWGVVNGAWGDWGTEISPKVRALSSARSRACLVNDFMRIRGGRLAEEDASIRIVLKQQMFVLVFSPPNFQGCIGIRLKKLDEDGLSKNQPTIQVKEFRGQIPLIGVEADYHLEVGYVVDRFGSALMSVDLVCPSNNGNYWTAEIMPNGANQSVSNLFPQEKTHGIKEVRIRKKSDKSDKQDGEKDAGIS
ncbi:MAG: hypothetical protein D4R39_01025 [Methylophilaceae bacterium]|nr:MAG: hypothetical protein D4R39_01025 [Methylophilaceae bacterium]